MSDEGEATEAAAEPTKDVGIVDAIDEAWEWHKKHWKRVSLLIAFIASVSGVVATGVVNSKDRRTDAQGVPSPSTQAATEENNNESEGIHDRLQAIEKAIEKAIAVNGPELKRIQTMLENEIEAINQKFGVLCEPEGPESRQVKCLALRFVDGAFRYEDFQERTDHRDDDRTTLRRFHRMKEVPSNIGIPEGIPRVQENLSMLVGENIDPRSACRLFDIVTHNLETFNHNSALRDRRHLSYVILSNCNEKTERFPDHETAVATNEVVFGIPFDQLHFSEAAESSSNFSPDDYRYYCNDDSRKEEIRKKYAGCPYLPSPSENSGPE